MPAKKSFIPKYCLHKPSGKAYCRIRGKVIYLGDYDSPESKAEYGRVVAEFAAQPAGSNGPTGKSGGTAVVEVIAAFMEHAEAYYGKNGKHSGHICGIRTAMRTLRELYAHTPAADFGPLALRAIQQKLIERGACRTYNNKLIGFIKLCFKWAVSHEMVSPIVHQSLTTVPGLRRGRTAARETKPVLPVDDELVDATLPYMPAVVGDMVRVQRLVGCRPGEVCQLRPCDIDQSGDVWVYRPSSHKTEHFGHARTICVGPRAQAILQPYLDRDPEAHCFSPAEGEAQRRAEQRAKRKTRVQPSQRNRRKAKRPPRTFYGRASYGRAIGRAIKKANKSRTEEAADMGIEPILLDHWHANQLRHSRATEVRQKYGLEAAQVILGHSKADVTQVYAERDTALAVEVSRKSG